MQMKIISGCNIFSRVINYNCHDVKVKYGGSNILRDNDARSNGEQAEPEAALII